MNSFLILMFFKEGLRKTIGVLIASLVNIFTNGKHAWKQIVRISLSFDVKVDQLKTTILQRQ